MLVTKPAASHCTAVQEQTGLAASQPEILFPLAKSAQFTIAFFCAVRMTAAGRQASPRSAFSSALVTYPCLAGKCLQARRQFHACPD